MHNQGSGDDDLMNLSMSHVLCRSGSCASPYTQVRRHGSRPPSVIIMSIWYRVYDKVLTLVVLYFKNTNVATVATTTYGKGIIKTKCFSKILSTRDL